METGDQGKQERNWLGDVGTSGSVERQQVPTVPCNGGVARQGSVSLQQPLVLASAVGREALPHCFSAFFSLVTTHLKEPFKIFFHHYSLLP